MQFHRTPWPPTGSLYDFTSIAELDIAGGDNGLVLAVLQRSDGAATTTTTAAQSGLYRISLADGHASLIGDIGAPAAPMLVRSLALRLR